LAEASIPFNALMPELPSMMIAHVLIPEIDATLPTSLSPALVQDFLRTQLGYNGIIFTDDLCMGAIAKQYTPAQSVSLALRAGCDLPLVCHNACEHLESIAEAISQLPAEIMEEVERRVNAFRFPLSARTPMTFIEWHDYLADNRAFNAEVPAHTTAAPGSPVQDY
jgi:beta-N-acetylhexosaminidase